MSLDKTSEQDYKGATPGVVWLMRMAWRDSRKSRSRLLLFISSMVLGIAALVAIYSLGDNLNQVINSQAASLLGADLELSSTQPPTGEIQHYMDSLGGQKSEQNTFASMVLFLRNKGTRLVQVRALQGQYPYYGSIETLPAVAANSFRGKQEALVDRTLMLQYGAQIGDSIQVGEMHFKIAGQITGAPGRTGFSASVAPIVYIPLKFMNQTGLIQKGSRIDYQYFFKFNSGKDVEALVSKSRDRLEANDIRYETVESQKRQSGRYFSDLTKFLLLVGFIALLLGSSGVASAVYVYVREKRNSIAILRCMGLRSSQAFIIFLTQIIGAGIVGASIGVVLGVIVQQFLPLVLKDFLPVTIHTGLSWNAIGEGFSIGVIVSILFALIPLLSIRKISPLMAIRASYEQTPKRNDLLGWVIFILLGIFIYGFTWMQMKNGRQAFFFTLGIAVTIGVLYLIAKALMWIVRYFFPSAWNYVWRQGLANLYRPNNQTTILLTSIGLGTALICTLFFVQDLIVHRITISSGKDQPNIVLFDIQTQQKQAVLNLANTFRLPPGQTVPIVNMRLISINGITALQNRKDSALKYPRWLFDREYRVTYRDTLTPSEKITAGKWTGEAVSSGIPSISLEQNYAKRSHLKLGDTLVFNVQGVEMPTRIGSLRQVNWGGIQTNFLVVFPKGTLENAPQFLVFLTKVPSAGVSAKFQEAVVQDFPNVSIIDLTLVLNVLNDLLGKISFVIRFMAGFSIITGLVVLIASVFISKYKRIEEIVLLRTLGASKKKVLAITAMEYGFLGALAAFCGILLALAASWALAYYLFALPFKPDLTPVIWVFLGVSALTIVTGVLNSLGFLKKSPLEVLRRD